MKIYETIYRLLADDIPIRQQMLHLIDDHVKEFPDEEWEPFRYLAYYEEARRLRLEWFADLLERDPPARSKVARLGFGLFNSFRGGEEHSDLRCLGTLTFNLDRGDASTILRPDYAPENRCAGSNIFDEMHALIREREDFVGFLTGEANYLAVGFVAFAVKEILTHAAPRRIVSSETPVGVTAGWDQDEQIYLGCVTPDGFDVRDPELNVADFHRRNTEV